jgi:hypothetical protein
MHGQPNLKMNELVLKIPNILPVEEGALLVQRRTDGQTYMIKQTDSRNCFANAPKN